MAFSVALNYKGMLEPVDGSKTDSNWNPSAGGAGSSKRMKLAVVTVTQDTTAYATGGLALDVLGALTGWSHITNVVSDVYTNNSVNTIARLVAANDGTAGNRKIQLVVCSTGAEVANSTASTAGTFQMMVFGY